MDCPALCDALSGRVAAAAIEIDNEYDRAAPLLVHAEGSGQYSSEKHYEQAAVVALRAAEPHAGSAAFERFTAHGPLALLPLAGKFGVVWAVRAEEADAL